jgi:acyl carrier protein
VTKPSESELIDLVIDWVKQNTLRKGTAGAVEITKDTDLFANGVLDSFGLVDLIVHIESKAGCTVDLTDADPNEFSVVKGLCRIASKHKP